MTTDELSDRLDSMLAGAVDRGRYVRHGLAAVAAADGTWSWRGAHGVLAPEGAPATTVSRYPVASVTKLYTAVVVMKLAEQGRLRLTDRMVDILSPEVTTGLHVLGGFDRTAEITVEHLLSHTSGLADSSVESPAGELSAQARLLAGEDAPMPFEEVLSVVRSLDPHFPPQPVDAPKRKAHYSDANYQLLGAIIESVCGQPLHAVFDSTLFGPLGLDATSSYPHPPGNGGSPEPDARIWAKDVVLRPEGALTFSKADGGIISTLGDQIKFMQALAGGEAFEDPTTWPSMYKRCSRVFFPVDYGLGVMRYAPSRLMSPLFPVPAIVGHTGSTATWLFHCPELEVVLAGTFDVAQPPLPFRFLPKVLRSLTKLR